MLEHKPSELDKVSSVLFDLPPLLFFLTLSKMHFLIPQLFLNSKMLSDRLVLFGDLFALLLNTFVMSWLSVDALALDFIFFVQSNIQIYGHLYLVSGYT